MASDSVRILSPGVDTLRRLIRTPPGAHVSAFVQLDRLGELSDDLALNQRDRFPNGSSSLNVLLSAGEREKTSSENNSSRTGPNGSTVDGSPESGSFSNGGHQRDPFLNLFDRVGEVLRSQYPAHDAERGVDTPTSVAVFARDHDAVILPLFFPVETTTVFGDRFCISPLLTLYGPQHATGLHITNQSASFVRQCGSFRSRKVLMRSVPGAFAMANPGQPASMTQVRPVVEWLRNIDRATVRHLPYPQHPVVLTGDPSICDAFRAINVHRHLIDGGNPFEGSSFRLHQQVCRAATAYHKEQRASALRDFYDARAFSRHRTSLDLHDICTEAASRRVQTLFIDERLFGAMPDAHPSGDGAMPLGRLPSCDDTSRVEHAIVDTLSAGGTVHTIQWMQLPPGSHVAAIFRY